MSVESPEVKIARIEERINAILDALDLARDSRKQQYEKLENMGRSLLTIEDRVQSVEQSLAATTPTIEEFVNIKLKVQGAGIAGKWAWTAGISVVTLLFTMREQLLSWFSK